MTEISKEYAVALFTLACERGEEARIMQGLENIAAIFAAEPAFLEMLSSPAIPLTERKKMVERVFTNNQPGDVVAFVGLLCEKRRLSLFDACVTEYRRLLHAREAIVTAKVTSAVALTEEEKKALQQRLEKANHCTVIPQYHLDPSLLGGVVVEIDGRIIDGSLRHRLRDVKEVMNQ